MPQKTIIIERSRPRDTLFSGARWARVIVNERYADSNVSGYSLKSEPLEKFIESLEGVDPADKNRALLELRAHFER